MRKLPFDLANLGKIDVQRAVRDQLDVVQTHHLPAVIVHRPIAAGDVHDRLMVQRLPDRPSPAGLEGPPNLVRAVRRRGRRQPERVGGLDAAKLDGKIGSHVTFLL